MVRLGGIRIVAAACRAQPGSSMPVRPGRQLGGDPRVVGGGVARTPRGPARGAAGRRDRPSRVERRQHGRRTGPATSRSRRWRGSWPPPGPSTARRCRSPRSSSSNVMPGRSSAAANGYRLTTTSSNGAMPASRSWRRWSSSRRSARRPPWIARMERLDPAVEHLRDAGDGGDVGHRQAGVAQRRAPCRRSTPARSRGRRGPRPSVDEPGLVRDRQQRAPRRRDARRRPARGRARRRPSARPSSAPARSSATARGSSRCSTARIRSWRVASSSPGRIGTASWATIGPPSSVASTRWTVQPVTAHAVASASRDGVGARERRQERRVGVEDPARRTRQHRGPTIRM